MAIDQKTKGQIKDAKVEKKAIDAKRKKSGHSFPGDDKKHVSISEAENGWTVRGVGTEFVAETTEKALEIAEELLTT